MDLRTGLPIWLDRGTPEPSFPILEEDLACDAAIVGSGVVGALVARELAAKGLSVVVLDKRPAGHGSTAASTALLLYDLDVGLADLASMIGEDDAARAYRRSLGALDAACALARDLGPAVAFRPKRSLYFASEGKDVGPLREEAAIRARHGLPAEFLDGAAVGERFALDAPAALVIGRAAEIDPYRFTLALLAEAADGGARVFSGAEVTGLRDDSSPELTTACGRRVRAAHVVMATGYESGRYLREGVVDLKSSYVIASEPVPGLGDHWMGGHLLWETARPYVYARTTADGRVLVGGEDIEACEDEARDARIAEKAAKLRARFAELVPDLRIEVSHAWAGTFGETRDGLGYVGIPEEYRHTYFALGFGGNGITFGVMAARMIAGAICGEPDPDAELFAFGR